MIKKLKELVARKNKQKEYITLSLPQKNFETIKPQEKKEKLKQDQQIRTKDTEAYVQTLVKKAYTQDKTVPYVGISEDQQKIQDIINTLKDDALRKEKKKSTHEK